MRMSGLLLHLVPLLIVQGSFEQNQTTLIRNGPCSGSHITALSVPCVLASGSLISFGIQTSGTTDPAMKMTADCRKRSQGKRRGSAKLSASC